MMLYMLIILMYYRTNLVQYFSILSGEARECRATPESGLSTAQYLLTSSKSCVACGVAVCVYIRARVIALRTLFTARGVVLLRHTGSALPLQTRRAPSGLRSSRHVDMLCTC